MKIKNIVIPIVLIFLFIEGVTGLMDMKIFNINDGFPLFILGLLGINSGIDTIKEGSKIYGYFVMILSGVLLVVSSLLIFT